LETSFRSEANYEVWGRSVKWPGDSLLVINLSLDIPLRISRLRSQIRE
jgi:hypothetical protein